MELSSFTNLFQNLQDYVVRILNEDEILQQMGCSFMSENSLDIEYQIREALNKQGLACLVMTPKATYQGHNGIQQTFTCDELTIQIVENPIINRARLKKQNLQHGTCLDVAKQASDRLAGPQGGYFGQFTTKRIQESESGGLLVCTATFGCTVYERLDAVLSGDLSGKWVEVPFVRTSELSDYIDGYLSTHMPAIEGYLPLSGGTMTGPLNVGYNDLSVGGYYFTDAWAAGLNIYDTATDQSYQFGGAPSEWSVVRQMDLPPPVDVPTKVSELSNDVGYITSAQVEPAEFEYGSTLSGYALKAWYTNQLLPVLHTGITYAPLKQNAGHLYLVYNGRLVALFNVPYDWSLSSFQGTQFSPPITMKYSWWPTMYIKKGHRVQTISRGWGWNGTYGDTQYFIQTAESLSSGYNLPTSATPDYFYTFVGSTSYTSKAITLTDNQLSIATYDGQTDVIECSRLSAGTTTNYNTIPYLDEVVKYDNDSPLTITVPYDNGLTIQTPNGIPLIQTVDLNRTAINGLSAGNIEVGNDVVNYPEAGVEPTSLSAWNWIKTRTTGLGTIIQNQHDSILGEVAEDYVAYNWLIQQGYTTSAQVNEALSNYLPLSGGQMQGGISWDYGGMGGPQIYGPFSPQQLAFTTTYSPDADKMVFLDFSRIEESTGQRTIAFVEDIDAVLGDLSALIHAT